MVARLTSSLLALAGLGTLYFGGRASGLNDAALEYAARFVGVRGIRNNNPGNIDWIAEPAKRWQGMIRKETPAEVILLSSCLPNPNWHWTSGRMPEYGKVTEKVAREKRCAFADVLSNWKAIVDRKKPEDLLSNNVNHPNDFGHWIYLRVLEGLGL